MRVTRICMSAVSSCKAAVNRLAVRKTWGKYDLTLRNDAASDAKSSGNKSRALLTLYFLGRETDFQSHSLGAWHDAEGAAVGEGDGIDHTEAGAMARLRSAGVE